MKYKKFLTWEFLLPVGIALWIVLWLVAFVAILLRIVAAIMVVLGLLDLAMFAFRKKEKPKEQKPQ